MAGVEPGQVYRRVGSRSAGTTVRVLVVEQGRYQVESLDGGSKGRRTWRRDRRGVERVPPPGELDRLKAAMVEGINAAVNEKVLPFDVAPAEDLVLFKEVIGELRGIRDGAWALVALLKRRWGTDIDGQVFEERRILG